MISLGAQKINCQYDNPQAFDHLLEAVEKYVTKEDLDAERQLDSSTPGGPDNNQLAFQVYCSTCNKIHRNNAYLSLKYYGMYE